MSTEAAPPPLAASTVAPDAGSTSEELASGKSRQQKSGGKSELPDVIATPCEGIIEYQFEDGLRRVAPYFWTYNTYCKERWRGRTLIDIFEAEFRDRTLEYYREAMERGTILVNGKAVGPDHVLRNGELINHTLHRHEPPVTAEAIGIIHEDEDKVVVNKPSGVPVHPAGRYKYNSLIEIMKAERGEGFTPYTCHRLDRLTSGLMILGKNAKSAEAIASKIKERTVKKEYIARVVGRFPDGEVVCDQAILQVSPKLGLNRVRAEGKSARTVFKRLAYYPREGETEETQRERATGAGAPTAEEEQRMPWLRKQGYSVVRCLPLTGRTHQIRVHLQFLGHPIENDPIYANQRVWGSSLGYNDSEGVENRDQDVIDRLERMGKEDVADAVAYYDEMVDRYEKQKAEKLSGEHCGICNTPLYTDPGERELTLWLHSLRYEDTAGTWGFVSPLPAWALPPAGMTGPTEVGGLAELVAAVKDEEPESAAA